MTTNEMAQKGFNTGFSDADGNELHVGDYVRLCGDIGEIVFSSGAFGIFIADEVPWDALEELVRKDSGNRPSFLYNDNFISFWEIVWNLSEDSDEPCLPHVKSVTATGGIFTDEEGNKDVFMGCISSCFATLTQCEHTCGRYYTCDTVAMANDLLRDDELGKEEDENNAMTNKTMKAEEIARAFLCEMNPVNWDGQGEMPAGVDTRTLSFPTDLPDVRLEISLELTREEDNTFQWEHYCELVQESSDTMIECAHGYGINSVQNLADTISYLLQVNTQTM